MIQGSSSSGSARKARKYMNGIAASFIVFSLLLPLCAYAQDSVDEEDLFADPEAVVGMRDVTIDTRPEEEKRSLGLSGEATGVLEYTGTRDWLKNGDDDDNDLASYLIGKFYVDARLRRGTKYFANVELQNNSRSDIKDFSIKESFIDFNIKRAAYFRVGKQVLQWGRCYLWNPSDLVNIEKKSFITTVSSREGNYGLKVHVPFGAKYNIYSFLDTNKAGNVDETGMAGKFEFVVGKTEMAFSAWRKESFKTVYAYDFSTRIFGIDTSGEAAFSRGDNYEKLREVEGVLTKSKEDDRWITRASIDFGKQFDFLEVNDRISLNLEFYYNQNGYTEDIFGDTGTYAFSKPVMAYDPSGALTVKTSGTKKEFLLGGNLYEVNNYSKYYAALFANMSKFIISDLDLALNLIGNLTDHSYILMTGVHYRDIHDLTLGLDVYCYLGSSDREYTFSNNAVTAQLTVGVLF